MDRPYIIILDNVWRIISQILKESLVYLKYFREKRINMDRTAYRNLGWSEAVA